MQLPFDEQVEHRQRHEQEEARQREQARAKREAIRAEEEKERLAADAMRQQRNRAANVWTLRGQDHKSSRAESHQSSASADGGGPWAIGTRVEALYQAQIHGSRRCLWYAGVIGSEADAEGRYDVHYDDGDVEAHVPPAYLRLQEGAQASRLGAVSGGERRRVERGPSVISEGSLAQSQGTDPEGGREKPAARQARPTRSASVRLAPTVPAGGEAGMVGAQGRARCTGDDRARGSADDDAVSDEGNSDHEEECIDWGETSDDGSDADYEG